MLESGRYVLAEHVAAFEREFAAYLGVAHGVGVNSGTDALILALRELGVRPGDEVITTPFTAIPTYAAIHHVGAVPVFVDIEADTFLMDLAQVDAAITPRTRGVVPVHLFGNAVDVEALRAIVGVNRFILEDCAQAHGAEVRGRRVGSLGDAAAFSFYPTKNLAAFGDGGAIVTNDASLAERLRRLRNGGQIDRYVHLEAGDNSRLDDLQAAVLRARLPLLPGWTNRRRSLAAAYRRALPDNVRPLREHDTGHVYHLFVVRSPDRDALQAHLRASGVDTLIHYPVPLHSQPAFAGIARGDCPVAARMAQEILSLPLHPRLTDADVARVSAAIGAFQKGRILA